jgi:ABC-type multidrug transport system permease subunit
MRVFSSQVRLGLVLALRNRMALIYGFIFPLIFLGAYAALYRHDEVPIALHLGELLTVTILGGACFGLPTTLVSERERGVWRRYRLAPVSLSVLIAATLTTRFILILAAALLQLGLALLMGMPFPAHPLGLLVAFTLAAFAFMGLGMLIAAVADNVPAVQALGQCIFLPMLIVGGVAVRLSALPDWALHLSTFLPGRYAVAAMQSNVGGQGLGVVGFDLMALGLIGAAAMIAGLRLFRWDAGRRSRSRRDWVWLALALSVWGLVGGLAIAQGRVAASEAVLEDVGVSADFVRPEESPPMAATAPVAPVAPPAASTTQEPAPEAPPAAPAAGAVTAAPSPADWRAVGPRDFARVDFSRLPPDSGLVAPIAAATEEPDALAVDRLERVRLGLDYWPRVYSRDPVQRARDLLYVAAVPDLLQMGDVERFLPQIVLQQLRDEIPEPELARALFWIAMHPNEGSDAAVGEMEKLGLPGVSGPRQGVRGRVMLYAFKFLGRLTGDLPPEP